MKMFPETLISRLKQLLTGGGGSGGSTDGNDLPRPSEPGNVSLLATDFSNLLRSKNSVTPSTGSDGTGAALDRDLSVQREVRRKYEALMQKFIPIANNPPALGAYERYTRKPINGDAVQRPEAAEAEKKHGAPLELTDDEEEHVQDVSDASDDCVEVTSKSAGRLFTTIDPHQLSAAQEREEEEQSAAAAAAALLPEPVNSVRARFETKHVFRDDIIQDVQARYGSLFSQRKSLIEQERHRLGSLRQCTQQQETEARNKLHHYVCSFYKFDVLDESELKEGTPEPEVVPLPELTREQLDEMQRKLRTGHQVVMEKFNLRITGNDLVTLQDMNWLNDAVINFYMELLRERGEQKRDQGLPKVYTMNTFFLPQLLKMGYGGVRRWTRKVDLLAHDMIVVPVHVGGIHWCMATIDLRRKTIHYYDSMGSPNNAVLNALEQYLCEESLDKRKAPFDKTGLTKQNMRDCPRQKNGSDCGVFSCMFAEFLSRDHPITFDQSNMPYFRKKMTVEIMLGKLLTHVSRSARCCCDANHVARQLTHQSGRQPHGWQRSCSGSTEPAASTSRQYLAILTSGWACRHAKQQSPSSGTYALGTVGFWATSSLNASTNRSVRVRNCTEGITRIGCCSRSRRSLMCTTLMRMMNGLMRDCCWGFTPILTNSADSSVSVITSLVSICGV
uniref:Ubiquitin-like protease family profile domain-containing protein n=1 Tax=Anopheles merus TaxID=30066 RepID=A0A182UU41_ANOME